MADNWASWYTGSMAPPLALPGGGYAPAPSSQPQMSPEEIYQGIYGEPMQLTSRSVRTVAAPVQASTDARFGVGTGLRASGSASYLPPALPNQPKGSVVTAKSDARLPQTSRDADLLSGYAPLPSANPALAAIGGATGGKLGAGGFGSGTLTAAPKTYSAPVHRHNVNLSEEDGQFYADSLGMPVATPNGTVYKPKIAGASIAPDGKVYRRGATKEVTGSMSAKDTRGPLSQLLGLKTSGLGGLLGGLWGGMQQRQGLGALLGMVPGVGAASAVSPALGYNAAYSQTPTGDGQGNNAFSSSDGYWGGARSLTD